MTNKAWDTILPKYTEWCIYDKEYSDGNVKNYLKILRWFSKNIPFPFTFEQVRILIFKLKKEGKSPGYINSLITVINTFMKFCQDTKLIQEDFTEALNKLRPRWERTPDPNDLLSTEEVKKLITSPTNRPTPPPNLKHGMTFKLPAYFQKVDDMYSLLLEFIYKTACRSGESIKLRKKDFNFSNHSVTFYETKTLNDRTVAIPPDMEIKLQEYIKDLSDSDYLFRAHTHKTTNQHITQEMVNKTLKYRAKLAGLKRPIHAHQLRHSCITHMLIRGAPLSTVQAIVGHKRLATTQLYTHIIVENQREAMLKYNPLISANQNEQQIFQATEDFINSLHLDTTDLLSIDFMEQYIKFIKNLLSVKLNYKQVSKPPS